MHKLGVQGQRKSARLSLTLLMASFAGAMFGGSFVVNADANGEYFLDR